MFSYFSFYFVIFDTTPSLNLLFTFILVWPFVLVPALYACFYVYSFIFLCILIPTVLFILHQPVSFITLLHRLFGNYPMCIPILKFTPLHPPYLCIFFRYFSSKFLCLLNSLIVLFLHRFSFFLLQHVFIFSCPTIYTYILHCFPRQAVKFHFSFCSNPYFSSLKFLAISFLILPFYSLSDISAYIFLVQFPPCPTLATIIYIIVAQKPNILNVFSHITSIRTVQNSAAF